MDALVHLLMKWNVNAVALSSEATEPESQKPFIAAPLTFFQEFPESMVFHAPVSDRFWKTKQQASIIQAREAS